MRSIFGSINDSFTDSIRDHRFQWNYEKTGITNQTLDLSNLSIGTFSRASEASYFTSTPTNGTTSFLAWAPSGSRRIEDRGDGYGPMYLNEGARTNVITFANFPANAFWSSFGSLLIMSGGLSTSAPDGGQAWRLSASSNGGIGENAATAIGVASDYICVSSWLKSQSGVSSIPNFNLFRTTTGRVATTASVANIWQRLDIARSPGNDTTSLVPVDGRDQSAVSGTTAGSRDFQFYLGQREIGTFPSSVIRSSGSATTRQQDILSYASTEYPSNFYSRGFTLSVAPDFSSIELAAYSADMYILSIGPSGNNSILFERNSGTPRIALYSGGVLKNSVNCTWSRYQFLTITVNLATGNITLNGFTTGNGTTNGSACSWPANSTLYIGTNSVNNLPFFGRISPIITAL